MPRDNVSLDAHAIRETLRLAALRRGFCAPNPSVGALILNEDQIIARGLHWASGCVHAEVDAFNKLLPSTVASTAVLYVSLEPCCHSGKTPPCTQAIIESGIREVVYGLRDPNPLVAGKGEQTLLAAGILCRQFCLPEVLAYYQSYCYWQNTQRPWVTAKLAVSLDGKIAGPGGQPASITGPELLQYTHQGRQHSDAILTTVKTIQADNPQLNVRLGETVLKKPVYVLDRLLTIPRQANIFNTAEKLTIFHQFGLDSKELVDLGARCIPLPLSQNTQRLDWLEVLSQIGAEGVQDLWVEAGGQCFQGLCEEGLLQRGLIYLSGKNLGRKAIPAFSPEFDVFTKAKTLQWQMRGGDAICELGFEVYS